MSVMKLDVLSTGKPTYWPTDIRKIPDVIDFCIIKGFSKIYFKVISPIRSINGNWAKSDKEKAVLFPQHLSEVFTPNQREISKQEEGHIHQLLEATHQMDLHINKINISETKALITTLASKKPPGYDLITGEILKQLPTSGFKFLIQMFNSILRTSLYPLQWKVAQIIMILKPGKNADEVKSYRSISLLPIASKVFEKLLYNRLLPSNYRADP